MMSKNILYCKTKTKNEIQQILVLQKQNLPNNLSTEEKIKEGFVSVSHTLDLLEEMNAICAHTIAKHNGKIIGYALSMNPIFADKIELLKPMFSQINELLPEQKNYIVMGQICIAKNYRKKGVFRNLYKEMERTLIPKYNCIITEVDFKNKRSLNAHTAIGFKILGNYISANQEWVLLILG
ncbi:GNAT family N-acetyltransferase [uncultured Maribacter sp.]|uniref:GNAT family N-acetyltransferase n=1 Tax=uncultured Maribacter sp. TaxID=431308 RepID=UPI002627BCA4|nr:GNAT family N-acetyltransferase [uncultured Maribacter sp.]